MKRLVLAAVVGIAIDLAPTRAAAELRMKWDCYLPNTGLDCVVLEQSLLSKIPFLRSIASRDDADVAVTVSSVPAESATRFLFHFEGKQRDGFGIEVHSVDKIPSSIDATTATVRIMTRLERGLSEFMDQKVDAEVKNGALAIQLVDPSRLPYSGRPEQHGVKWYLSPSVGSYFSDVEGVGINASGTASLTFNYSATRWRLQSWLGGNYTRLSQPVPGTVETASISFLGANANTIASWALTRNNTWSFGFLVAGEKNPQANYNLRANASVGLEFDLVPRQTVNQKNFGGRCAIGPELQRYSSVNIEGIEQQFVARQFCDVFLSWHFLPIDVAATLGETWVLKNVAYRSFALSLSATWRLTDNFTVSPWVTMQEIDKAINAAEPTNVVYTDPKQEIEASMIAAIQQTYTSPFGVQSGLSLRYLFGNGSLNSEDQRWKGASNLR